LALVQNRDEHPSTAAPKKKGALRLGREKGIKVPLPILFFLLMTLVIVSVLDIMSQSQEVHQLANQRVAKVILDGTLKSVHTNLNGYAARLASQGGTPNVDRNELFRQLAPETSARLSKHLLILYIDNAGQVISGYVGPEPLSRLAIDRLSKDVQDTRVLSHEIAGVGIKLRMLTTNAVDYVISDSSTLPDKQTADGPSHVLIGLPVEDILISELRKYEIFSTGSLSNYLEHGKFDGFASILRHITEFQNEEYREFHLDAAGQLFIVLIAFVICVMIGQHVDEKNDALSQSHSEIAKREEEAHQLRQIAEKASAAKSRFIANMSHELRTPLNAILGYSELIKGESFGKLDGAQKCYKEHAENIYAGGMRLLSQISQVLDFSALETGDIELTKRAVDIEQILSEACSRCADRLSAQDVMLEADIAPNLPQLLADPHRITDLFHHLISNAAKFGKKGGTVRVRARVNRRNAIEVCVTDDGMGIESDLIDAICEPFVQGQDVYCRNHQGVGLGLALAKAYAELHGAVMSIESEPGVGTEVTILFPPQLSIGEAPSGMAQVA
jgi:signal transduction histidine kinase